jgi:hypothetical protein
MSKRPITGDSENFNQTTESTLVALTVHINKFVNNRTLDSRCAARLIERLRREARIIADNGHSTWTGTRELEKALSALDVALRAYDASLLVAANAALRTADSG